MEIKDFLTLQTYSQWRQSIVVIPGSNLQIKIFGRSTHISCSTQKFPGTYHTCIIPGTFLHSAWPLYLSLPRNQCMTMINERIAYATCKKIIETYPARTVPMIFLHSAQPLHPGLAPNLQINLQINFSGSLRSRGHLIYQMVESRILYVGIKESMQHVFLSGERGGPACGWWKVDSTMSKPGNNGSMWHFFLCVKDKNAKSD